MGWIVVALSAAAVTASASGVAGASPDASGPSHAGASDPTALNGTYVLNRALDRQTFNGAPAPSIPFAGLVKFDTTCDATGCVAHSSLTANDVPIDFRWSGSAWRSVQHFDWTCGDQTAPATVIYTLTPSSNGTLYGSRQADVGAPGCGTAHLLGTVVAPLTAAPA